MPNRWVGGISLLDFLYIYIYIYIYKNLHIITILLDFS